MYLMFPQHEIKNLKRELAVLSRVVTHEIA